MTNKLTDEEWQTVIKIALVEVAKLWLYRGFWIGMLIGWCLGGGVMLLLQ